MMKFLATACAVVVMAGAVPAGAATLFQQAAPTGITASPGSYTYTFGGNGGTGQLSFDLDGYRTLDGGGSGGYEDLFTLTLNGTVLSSGYFPLGGSGTTQLVSGAAPVTVVNNGFNNGGRANYALNNVALASGTNTLTFAYSSGIPQGTGDEGWGVSNILVTGPSAVPEPATWAMMLVGFGGIGGMMRRRKQVARVSFA